MNTDIPASSSSSSSSPLTPPSSTKRARGGPQEGRLEGAPAKRIRDKTSEGTGAQTPSIVRKRLAEGEPAAVVGAVTSISSRRRVTKEHRETPFSEVALVKHLREDFQKLAQRNPDNLIFATSLTSEREIIEACKEVCCNKDLKIDWIDFSPSSGRFLGYFLICEDDVNASFIRAFDSLSRNVPSDNVFNQIGEEISSCSKEQIGNLAELLKQSATLYGEIPEDRQNNEAAVLLLLIPEEKRREAKEPILSLVKGSSTDEQRHSLVHGLNSVPKEKRLELLEVLHTAYKGDLPNVDWQECVQVLAHMPANRRAEMLPTLVSLFEGYKMSESELSLACRQVPPVQLANVLYHAQRICVALPEYLNRTSIVQEVAQLPMKQRGGLVDGACFVCEGLSDVTELDEIFEAIKHLVPAERTGILRQVKELMRAEPGGLSEDLDVDLIRAVASIDRRDRRDCVKQAKPLIPKVGHEQASKLISLLGSISRVERESVASLSLTLLEGVSPAISLGVIEEVSRIPREDRDELIATYLPRVSGIQNGLIKALILQEIASFVVEDRERVLPLLLPIASRLDHSNAYSFFECLNYYALMSDDKIALITTASLPIFQGITVGEALIDAVFLYNKASLNVRDELHILLERFSAAHTRMLFGELARIADPDRPEVLRYALRLLPSAAGQEQVWDIQTIIRSIGSLTPGQREAVFSLADVVDADSLEDASLDIIEQSEPGQDFSDRPSYKVVVSKEQFENEPEKMLEQLTDAFTEEKTLLSVEYPKQQAQAAQAQAPAEQAQAAPPPRQPVAEQEPVDAGGPGRQFVSDLFFKLIINKLKCKEIGQSGLYRPKLQSGTAALTAEEKKIYHNLGRMMMFCLNATREYPIGTLFDEGVFTALLGFSDELLENEFEKLDAKNSEAFSALLKLFEKMNALLDNELQSVCHAKAFLDPLPADQKEKNAFLQSLYSLVEYEDGMEAIKYTNVAELEQHLATMQAALRDKLFNDVLRLNLAPLHEIARGMKSAPFANKLSWAQLHEKSPGEIATRVQGVLVPALIVKSLSMVQPVVEGVQRVIPEEKQQWLRNWIEQTSEENLKLFLQQITGSRALGKDKTIQVRYAARAEDPFNFRTCFNWVSIPFDAFNSEEEFRSGLNTVLLLDASFNRG